MEPRDTPPRPPTARQRKQLQRRRNGLSEQGLEKHLNNVSTLLSELAAPDGAQPPADLRLRTGFSYRGSVPIDASDRKAPPREQRPPATRVSSSQGSTLGFLLTLLALVQWRRRLGAKANLGEFGLDVAGSSGRPGWADLVGRTAADAHTGNYMSSSRDKRARMVRSCLRTLKKAGLVDIASFSGRAQYGNFTLLNETGREAVGELEEYKVPGRGDMCFSLPFDFVRNGWVHVLADSEIAVLLMVACAQGSWVDDGLVAIPAGVRLGNYGIHRDPFSSALKTLQWFGLLEVREVGRHTDGRAEEDERMLHRLGLKPAGFASPAVAVMREALGTQLS